MLQTDLPQGSKSALLKPRVGAGWDLRCNLAELTPRGCRVPTEQSPHRSKYRVKYHEVPELRFGFCLLGSRASQNL